MKRLEAQLKKLNRAIEKGASEGVKKATEITYKRVIDNASYNHIVNHNGEPYINKDFDASKIVGTVWSNDPVIIYNEFGTGIRGVQDEWANEYGYQVNASGKGESGWLYPKDDGTFGFTHGLPSRHMFYDAYLDTKKDIKNYMMIEISKNIGGDE